MRTLGRKRNGDLKSIKMHLRQNGKCNGTESKPEKIFTGTQEEPDQRRKSLWYNFLSKYPCRFRRQYVIGNYIADFYCHKEKLVVELDGSQHYSPEEMEYDKTRTQYLEQQGLRVLRFTNLDILRQFRSVCEAIDMAVKERVNCGR